MERSVDLQHTLEEYSRIFGSGGIYSYEKSPEQLINELIEGTMELGYIKDPDTEEILAFCFFYRLDLHYYYIEYLGVPDRHQGKGLGKKLLVSVVEHCVDSDPELIEGVRLLCPDDKVTFYERNGFRRDGLETDEDSGIIWNKMVHFNNKNG